MAAGFRLPSATPPPLLPLLVLVFSCLLMLLPLTSRGDYSCPNSKSAFCDGVNISYPFWLSNEPNQDSPYCGCQGFLLTCQDGRIPVLRLGDHNYRVLSINYTETVVTLADDDIFAHAQGPPCPRDVTWPSNVSLSYADTEANLTFFFNCSDSDSRWTNNEIPCLDFSYEGKFNHSYVFWGNPNEYGHFPKDCSDVAVWPIPKFHERDDYVEKYEQILHGVFKLLWTGDTNGNCSHCEKSGGRCGYNKTDNATLVSACFCSEGEVDVIQIDVIPLDRDEGLYARNYFTMKGLDCKLI